MTATLVDPNINGAPFKVPVVASSQIYKPVTIPRVEDLTSGSVGGAGVFDKLMSSILAHLKEEFDKNRITGSEYSRTYIELTQAAMNTAMQFVLTREQTFWAAQQAQIGAIDGLIKVETSRAAYATAQYNFEILLPLQAEQSQLQIDTATYNLNTALPAQTALLNAQTDTAENQALLVGVQKTTADYNLSTTLPAQLALIEAQTAVATKQSDLVEEQTEAQRAQTMDTRSDGTTTVAGEIGKRKALLTQQVTSFQRDSEVKAAKLFTDAWITNKTIDEGVTVPDGFTNASIDDVLSVLKTNNGFV
jgi:hypothetical protein